LLPVTTDGKLGFGMAMAELSKNSANLEAGVIMLNLQTSLKFLP
jgi:hypothetical protein